MYRISLFFLLSFSLLFAEAMIVKDSRTDLMWEDKPHVKEVKITQPRAKKYCQNLKLGNFTNWRLPTIKELLSIVDYSRVSPATFTAFSFIEKESFYWSSTPLADADDEYWGVNFKRGESSRASEYYDRYVRCVREMK
jgi:hypothetical protein